MSKVVNRFAMDKRQATAEEKCPKGNGESVPSKETKDAVQSKAE
jgi:hypothetical protein